MVDVIDPNQTTAGQLKSEADSRGTTTSFGTRTLTLEDDVYSHNAWDDVHWDDEQMQLASAVVESHWQHCNSKTSQSREDECDESKQDGPASPDLDQHRREEAQTQKWNEFYGVHANRFFKDRNWLFREFPELQLSRLQTGAASDGRRHVYWELGCGVGNTVVPIRDHIRANADAAHIFCSDFSAAAIDLVRAEFKSDVEESRGVVTPFVFDMATSHLEQGPSLPDLLTASSVDVVLLIFSLSALRPADMQCAVDSVVHFLRPGGIVLFRDYGQYDMAQLRFKARNCIGRNWYVRGDGTTSYFFARDALLSLFCGTAQGSRMRCDYIREDRRLQVNRGKQVKMFRVWLQAKFTKID